jgi:ATP-dependent exoDNAse (exonuclease V) beta subunit
MVKQKKKNQTELDLNFDTLITLEKCFDGIKFFDKNHTYTIDNNPAKMSVSGLIKKYEKPFDQNRISEYVAKRDEKTVEQVLSEWEYLREYSCYKGSEFHKFVENFLSRKQTTIDKQGIVNFFRIFNSFYKNNSIQLYYEEMAHLIKNFLNFYEWWKKDHILIKSEFVVGDKLSNICGTIDNLSFNKKTKEFVIFDYKTNKEIKKQNPRDETFLAPFEYLSHCEYIKYSLQMWLYQTIIEKNSPYKVPSSYIVWIADKKNFELMETLNLKKEAEMLLNG